MDFCINCELQLFERYCSRCKMIYRYEFSENDRCQFCNKQSIQPEHSDDRVRYTCEYCNYKYFYYKYFVDDTNEINEFKLYYERECDECKSKVKINNMTEELVCSACGLIHDIILMRK